MKKNYLLLIFLLTYFVSPVKSQTDTADIWIADTFYVDSYSIEYRLFLPANYDSTVKYPLILVFGGINLGNENYFVNFDNAASNISFADSLELITISGSIIYQSKVEGNFHRINLRELSSGIYFVRVTSNDFVSVRKVIKE